MSLYLSQLFEQEIHGVDVVIKGLANDSRHTQQGDLFFAYQGEQSDGHDFIEQAIANGAVAVALEDVQALKNTAISYVQLDQLRSQLSAIAGRFYQQPSQSLAIAAVTGTNGKTSISHYIAQLYSALDKPCAVIGTLGSYFASQYRENINTTPDALCLQQQLRDIANADTRYVAMEVSSHALVQQRQAAVKFDVAVFSNLTAEHLDYHGDMESYFAAKKQLFTLPSLQAAVINADDIWGQRLSQALAANVRLLDYSWHNTAAYMYVLERQFVDGKFIGQISINGQTYDFTLPLVGEFNLSNAMAASCVLLARGEQAEQVIAAWGKLLPAKGRMQHVENSCGIQAIVDYAHTADALDNVLKNIARTSNQKLIVVFGCGGNRDAQKRPDMAKVAEQYANTVIITDDNPRKENPAAIRAEIIAGFRSNSFIEIADRKQAIIKAVSLAGKGDVIVLAGKGHEQVQVINDAAILFDDVAELSAALNDKERLC